MFKQIWCIDITLFSLQNTHNANKLDCLSLAIFSSIVYFTIQAFLFHFGSYEASTLRVEHLIGAPLGYTPDLLLKMKLELKNKPGTHIFAVAFGTMKQV